MARSSWAQSIIAWALGDAANKRFFIVVILRVSRRCRLPNGCRIEAMTTRILLLAAALLAATNANAMTDDEGRADVRFCLAVVHQMKPKEDFGNFYGKFDAYYNPTNKGVIENVRVNGDLEPRYYFNKCLVEQRGWNQPASEAK
jgi:hypothetical protein